MVVKGKPRGNAPQLADYLLAMGENESITILNVDGRMNASEGYLRNVLYSMELNSELTRSNQSVYHAILRPDPDIKEDRAMTAEDWHRSADILGQHLTLDQQRRVIVLHEKDGTVHAHVVFERYDHEHDRMIDYKNNYKAHDKARFEIEREFGHKHTPQKNMDRPKHKKTLTELWRDTKSGEEFIRRAEECGYQVAKGTDRPFKVVDEKGVSFNLLNFLDGVKTKEVRQRLGGIELMDDKKAIKLMSNQGKEKQFIKPQQGLEYSPVKEVDMNWDHLIKGKEQRSYHEIAARREGKMELALQLKLSQKKIDEIKDEYAAEMNDTLNSRCKGYMAEAGFEENAKDLDTQNKAYKTASLLEKHKEQKSEVTGLDLEREQFLKSMQEARQKNRDRELER